MAPGISYGDIQRLGAYAEKNNVIDTYCCSIPRALALSAIVVRRMMMEMLSFFVSVKLSANEL